MKKFVAGKAALRSSMSTRIFVNFIQISTASRIWVISYEMTLNELSNASGLTVVIRLVNK